MPVYLAFAATAPVGWLRLLPAAAVMFLLARAAFLIGLLKGGAPQRAIGFACTFYPAVLMLVATLVFWGMG